MKKFLCLLLCLVMFASTACAADKTTAWKFRNQVITGGSGIKGTVSLTASGVADWLEYLLPFTATEMQVRIIGQAHGKYSDAIPDMDDDDWQMRVYAEDGEGNAHATTRLYGDPNGIYLTSDLLPEVLLTYPAKDVQLPYSVLDGEFASLFIALDPLGLMTGKDDGNPSAYSALAELFQVSEEEWAANWLPVLEKYDTELEMWLAAYTTAPVVAGGTGAMTVKSTYRIPGDDVKAQAKKIIGMILYDQELLPLLTPFFTATQQAFFLDPAMAYFYEYCIDQLPLNGDVVLESELSAMGETVSMVMSLPMPQLPAELITPVNELFTKCFSLPYTDLFSGIDRVSYARSGDDVTLSMSSPARTISMTITETVTNSDNMKLEGIVRIEPVAGSTDAPLAAAFTFKTAHAVQNDDSGAQHDDTTYALTIEPDLTLVAADDPFRSSYIDFAPIGVELALNYYTKNPRAENTATRLQIDAKLQLPGADIGLAADLRTTGRWDMETLRTTGAENILALTEDRKETLLETLLSNAIGTMVQLNNAGSIELPTETEAPEATEAPAEPEPTEAPIVTDTDLALPAPTEVPPLDANT